MVKKFQSRWQTCFFSFDLSSTVSCRAAKLRHWPCECRRTKAMFRCRDCGSLSYRLPRAASGFRNCPTVGCKFPIIRRAVESSAGSSLGFGPLGTKLVVMHYSVQYFRFSLLHRLCPCQPKRTLHPSVTPDTQRLA